MPLRSALCAALALLLLPTTALHAQQTPPRQPFTLHTQVREVLTDITVTDANGKPVQGLSQNDFHVYDDGHPQAIQSFTAHSGKDLAVTRSSTAPGTYSNRYLTHPPAAYNVVLVDTKDAGLTDQLYLSEELIRLVRQLPSGEPLALYAVNGQHVVLMQNFTANHAALLAAVRQTVPRFRDTDWYYDSDVAALAQLAGDLSQYPGRKNVLWFTGDTDLHLFPGIGSSRDYGYLHPLYNTLESERIALYPIDLRGLTVARGQAIAGQAADPGDGSTTSSHTGCGNTASCMAASGARVDDIHLEHQLMLQAAESTGGRAYINTNSLAAAARQILDHSADYYTIVYTPNDIHHQDRWHHVRITVINGYHLSYRHGYYVDDSGFSPSQKALLLAKKTSLAPPDAHSQPILFQVHVQPASAAEAAGVKPKIPGYARAYTLQYILPAADFAPSGSGSSHISIGTAAVVMNDRGLILDHRMQRLQLRLNAAELRKNPHGDFAVTQTIGLPKGHDHLYLAVWDASTGRMGTLDIPLQVTRH
jgi:VWFA-related protein